MAHSLVFKNIPTADINITPFLVFKNWSITHADYSSIYDVKIKRGVMDTDWAIYDFPEGFAEGKEDNLDGSSQESTWYHVNGMYYKKDKSNLDIEYSAYMRRNIHATASYIQIPQQIFGEGIKLRSVEITNGDITLKDDGFGHLVDTSLVTGSMPRPEYLAGYWGFNDTFKYRTSVKQSGGTIVDGLGNNPLLYKNVSFLPGLTTTGAQTVNTGLKVQLDGTGCIWKNDATDFNYKHDEDFAISIWTELPVTQSMVSSSYNFIVSKQGDIEQAYRNKKTKELETFFVEYNGVKYPYAIKVHNQTSPTPGKVEVSRCDIAYTPTIISTTTINDNNQHHILFNKTGSTLELWIDSVNEGSTLDTTLDNTHNPAILTVGSNGYDNGTGLVGSLDEFRIYNKGLSPTEIASLSNMDYATGSAYNTNIVGNVFYPQGTMVVSDPRPKYQNVLVGNAFDYTSSVDDNFNLKFRSTLTLYENEILCRVAPGEFNFTANPSIRQYNDPNSQFAKPFVTGSNWHPYVSSIGLYDQYGRLLAVGKTAQAIPLKDDIETTFIVRYDE